MTSRKNFYGVTNTKLAAALLTVGVPFADPRDPMSNIYTEGRPYRPGRPGNITYHLASESAAGVPAADLAAAWHASEADADLDRLVDEISAALPHLGARLRHILPRALMCYLRGAAENRDRILDLWKKVVPMVLVKKSPTSFALVSRDAPPHIRARCGLS